MMREKNRQIFTTLPDLNLYSHFSAGKIYEKNASNLPHICWPDGTPCTLANLYILKLLNRPGRSGNAGLSRRGSKGGTIGEYSGKVSQLVRHCYYRRIDFIDLDDDSFTEFIHTLRNEVSAYNPECKRRNEQTITSTGHTCLDFLSMVGNFFGEKNFVSDNGTIRAEKRFIKHKDNKLYRGGSYWHHHSLSNGDRLKARNPISAENIKKLRTAAHSIESSRFIEQRRQCLISLLEQTGARRGEISELRIRDIEAAINMKEPMLKLATLKGRDCDYRYVPVFRILLSELKKFIRIHRNRIIKETKPSTHDLFFISEINGKPLAVDTLTKEISILRKEAGITEQACAHMFRHAFCTNLFILLIERHEFENEDKFRQQLIGSETFKAEVMQWTGHKSPDSLERYIHAAFAKKAKYANTLSSVDIIRIHEIYDNKLSELLQKVDLDKITFEQYKEELTSLRVLRDQDFKTAHNKSMKY